MLNIVICDDGRIQRKLLNILIHEYEEENGVRFNLYEFDSGEEVIAKFNNKACHIVFVTASEKSDFMEASPLVVLFKPVQKEDLNKILDRILAGKIGEDVEDKNIGIKDDKSKAI